MNQRKYKNSLYPVRPVADLRDLLRSSAALYNDQPAYLVKDDHGVPYRPVSFRQTLSDVEALGTALTDLGLLGKRVAVIGENSYEWVLAYLAVTCGLGVVVPIEKDLGTGDIRHLLQRSCAAAIFYPGKMEETVRPAFEGLGGLEHAIRTDGGPGSGNRAGNEHSIGDLVARGARQLENGDRRYVDRPIDREAMSVLLFTSGTTGIAKGVMLCHRNLIANITDMSTYVNVNGFVGLSVLPMHHTYEMTCHILTSLYQGCTVAMCEGLRYIVENMKEAKVNVMLGVPLIFESMHKRVWKQAEKSGKAEKLRKAVALSKRLRLENTNLPKKLFKEIHATLGGGIRLLVSGAAAIDPSVMEDFCAMGLPMIQGYGMTECSPIITVNKDRYSKPASAGLPLPHTEVRIEEPDENGIGEILCKSESVMLGYLDDPAETAATIQDGWLHTGDYGYFDGEGFLYITGRKKNVIVTKNGKNIFPEEVELYLGKSGFIAECMVYGVDDAASGETVVCAEIFPDHASIEESHGPLSGQALRVLLKVEIEKANDRLPPYKRIRRFDIRETEFEKTGTRKIKRYLAGRGGASGDADIR